MLKIAPTTRKNMFWALGVYVYFLVFYLSTNRIQLFEARTLFVFEFERQIPIMPWTSWIYHTAYILPLFTAARLIMSPRFKWAAMAIAAQVTVSCIIFLFYPTVIDRPMVSVTGIGSFGLWLVQWLDQPYNCFPSLHVGLCFTASLIYLYESRRIGLIMLIWSLAIAVTTLTTKQHYLLDVLGGGLLSLGIVVGWYGRRIGRDS